MSDSVLVAVRVRPFNEREKRIKGGTQCIVSMQGNSTTVKDPDTSFGQERTFSYDYSYWSHDENSPNFSSQETVFNDIGRLIINNAFEGYNTSLFAYGQTGSGKTYTMMGTKDEEHRGIIPRICRAIFQRIKQDSEKQDGITRIYRVETSMIEIYNEHVRDLFNPENPLNNKGGLKIRENPETGPYIEGMESCVVHNEDDILRLMDEGNRLRTIAKTNMNDTSSRAHTIFQIILASSIETAVPGNASTFSEKVSIINLIDLAGSERADKTGATGERLKEGSAINVSLTALGDVINKLSEKAENPNKKVFVPYRNSVLTWLLKESLGGNSKTIMLATVSPSDYNYQETLSTLRYASRAKSIKNKAKVNEDPNATVIRELRDEIARLKSLINESSAPNTQVAVEDDEKQKLREQLAHSQQIIEQLQNAQKEKERRTQEIERARRRALEEAGIAFTDMGEMIRSESMNVPNIVNLNEDPMMSGLLVYSFKIGETFIGRDKSNNIVLSGLQIKPQHCVVIRNQDKVTLKPIKDALLYVNGRTITCETVLNCNDRIILGNNHVFRYVDPNGSEAESSIDWAFAQEELAYEQKRAIELAVEEKEKEIEQNMKLRILEIEKEFEKQKYQQQEIIERQVKELEQHKQKIEEMDEKNRKKKKSLKDTVRGMIKTIQHRFLHRDEKVTKPSGNISRNRIDENLIRLLPMIKEANDIVREFNNNIRYDLKILVKNAEPQLGIQAVDKERKKTTMWTVEEFEARLVKMREKLASLQNPVLQNDDSQDPFYGCAIDVVASAKMELKYLARRQSKEELLSLQDTDGNEIGKLLVAIVPLVPGDETMKQLPTPVSSPDDLLGDPLHFLLKIKAVKELSIQSKDNFIRFRFYTEKPITTSKQNGTNLLFNFHRRYCVRSVNVDLIEYLEDGFIQFDLVGEVSQEEKWNSIRQKTLSSISGLSSSNNSDSTSLSQHGSFNGSSPVLKRKAIPSFSPPSSPVSSTPRTNELNQSLDTESYTSTERELAKENELLKARIRRMSIGSSTSPPRSRSVIPPQASSISSYSILIVNLIEIIDCPYPDGDLIFKISLSQGSENKSFNEKAKSSSKTSSLGKVTFNEQLTFSIVDTVQPSNKLKVKLVHNKTHVLKLSTTINDIFESFQKGQEQILSFSDSHTKLRWSFSLDI
ncbi:hypothetical protein C9374_001235 [Naegleria lovaniensis]|uniref:Kinesin motor domain-containing protein n=1 Tax=Naegleria lovaniensis TaxID=51637 RepID=A0AA88KNJ4_NAELO|nr:uncharacterized protein C9374_001235 [Naegleria lovaniensis]KAG2387641.1 hypothetical protein C9374_001235 [Naegleria lovaniensis]